MADLVGLSEIAQLAGVTRQAVANWRTRHASFPHPAAVLGSGPVWRRVDVVEWLKSGEVSVTKVISFINLKGGVGKTTSTVAVAEFLAKEHKKRVLVVDLDPQTNATVALIPEDQWRERDDKGQTLKQLFEDKLKTTKKFDINKAIIEGVSNIDGGLKRLSLLPSSLGLIDIQDQLALIPGGSYFAVSPVDILQTALRPVLHEYDYVLIDCPPNLGIITLNGIGMSTGYVIPVIPDILSTYGIPQILDRVNKFAAARNVEIPARGIIVSKFRQQSGLHESKVQQLRRDAAANKLPFVFETVIPEAAHIGESADINAAVNTLRQKYGYGNNYGAYASLVQEFIERC